jgi:hypothetical protein
MTATMATVKTIPNPKKAANLKATDPYLRSGIPCPVLSPRHNHNNTPEGGGSDGVMMMVITTMYMCVRV